MSKVINQEETCKRIVALRKERGISPNEIAKALNVSPQAVNKWMLGSCLPSLDNLIVLADLFGLTINDLLVLNDVDLWK